jgi:uncharacterized protein (DUF2267 family)
MVDKNGRPPYKGHDDFPDPLGIADEDALDADAKALEEDCPAKNPAFRPRRPLSESTSTGMELTPAMGIEIDGDEELPASSRKPASTSLRERDLFGSGMEDLGLAIEEEPQESSPSSGTPPIGIQLESAAEPEARAEDEDLSDLYSGDGAYRLEADSRRYDDTGAYTPVLGIELTLGEGQETQVRDTTGSLTPPIGIELTPDDADNGYTASPRAESPALGIGPDATPPPSDFTTEPLLTPELGIELGTGGELEASPEDMASLDEHLESEAEEGDAGETGGEEMEAGAGETSYAASGFDARGGAVSEDRMRALAAAEVARALSRERLKTPSPPAVKAPAGAVSQDTVRDAVAQEVRNLLTPEQLREVISAEFFEIFTLNSISEMLYAEISRHVDYDSVRKGLGEAVRAELSREAMKGALAEEIKAALGGMNLKEEASAAVKSALEGMDFREEAKAAVKEAVAGMDLAASLSGALKDAVNPEKVEAAVTGALEARLSPEAIEAALAARLETALDPELFQKVMAAVVKRSLDPKRLDQVTMAVAKALVGQRIEQAFNQSVKAAVLAELKKLREAAGV